MSLYKLVRRDQRIQALLSSFPKKENKSKGDIFLIDSSFKRMEMEGCSPVEMNIFKETVNQLIKKEKIEQTKSLKIKQNQTSTWVSPKLTRVIRKKEENQEIASSIKKEVVNFKEPSTQKVYLERKYNSKLAYQIHNIIQAKQIEISKHKTMNMLNLACESPLIRNTVKITRTERQTDNNYRKQIVRNIWGRNERSERKNRTFNVQTCQIILKNEKIRQAFKVKERDLLPVTIPSQNQLKRYSSSVYLSSVAPVSKQSHRCK